MWREYESARAQFTFDAIICVNVAGVEHPGPFDYWASYHPELYFHWQDLRKQAGRPVSPDLQLWAGIYHGKRLGERIALPLHWINCGGGSSGFLATMVALQELKAWRVVLCWVPMENTPRFDDPSAWREAVEYRQTWLDAKPDMQDRVRSMSGWTKEILGEPTKEWFDQTPTSEHHEGLHGTLHQSEVPGL